MTRPMREIAALYQSRLAPGYRRQRGARGAKLVFTVELQQVALKLRAKGLPVDAIAEKLGVSPETFRRWRALTPGFQMMRIPHSQSWFISKALVPETHPPKDTS